MEGCRTTVGAARSRVAGTLALVLGATLLGWPGGPLAGSANPGGARHPYAGERAWVTYQTYRDGREGVWLVRPDGTGDHELDLGLPEGVTGLLPDWSPDGRRLVVTTRGGESEPLHEHDLATGATRQLFDCTYPCFGDDEPAYSPDGATVAFVRYLGPPTEDWLPSDCGLWLGDVRSGAVRQITSNTVGCDREYVPAGRRTAGG